MACRLNMQGIYLNASLRKWIHVLYQLFPCDVQAAAASNQGGGGKGSGGKGK